MSTHDDLTFAVLDPQAEDPRTTELLAGWGKAVVRGFHQARMDETGHRLWLEATRADRAVLRGAWPARTTVGSATVPVATFCSFDKELNVGGGHLLPLRMITDVTVSPTHRRRGLLRSLMTADLADAAERGVPVAALTATEGSIYARFGFGAATWRQQVLVDTDARFALRKPVGPGSVELVEPGEAWPVIRAVYDRHLAQVRGACGRPENYEAMLTARYDWEERGPDHKMWTAIHLDASGTPDGYVCYGPVGEVAGRPTLQVSDLVALDPAAHLGLWRYLADVDLADQVRHRTAVDDPLPWALVDPRVVRATGTSDLLWVRVLDVPVALAARPWWAEGEVVLEVDDALGHAAGRWRVRARDGHAQVTADPDGTAPAVRLDAAALGSLYLGGVSVGTLHAAGRLEGPADAVATLAALADGGPAPYCSTAF
ncbi:MULTISPECIES: GNAT family N-acetyltransferase [unclassified Nocardioides]|uniref:GNAT family N-acetyltransferase n=1 Tax=unclassified Nocardioides TaxID=2615069 RepID=UPI001885FC66|nr:MULTISPECIES: GNAT family N-acetyltransferase [unclassified Nocardioides]